CPPPPQRGATPSGAPAFTERPMRRGLTGPASVPARILVDLLKLNVAPLAVFQMLKSMCAGQRLASEPQDPAAVSLPTSTVPETRGRNKGSTALGGALALAERSSREGSSQRMPRQPSATRLPKGGGPGKSPTRGST
uniref:Mitotic spindle organizing protein 2B n=1 Tax=Mandrillus leucophaeus TaxID=9568 RepID=A0A2K5ZVL4_MANLE